MQFYENNIHYKTTLSLPISLNIELKDLFGILVMFKPFERDDVKTTPRGNY